MSIDKKISEFISVDGFDTTTQIPIVQGNPMFNGKITPEKFAEALGIIAGGDLTPMVTLTEAEYDNLSPKDPNTYYFIKES